MTFALLLKKFNKIFSKITLFIDWTVLSKLYKKIVLFSFEKMYFFSIVKLLQVFRKQWCQLAGADSGAVVVRRALELLRNRRSA